MKKIALVGAESTGKTTLAEALAAHFQTIYVLEYGRIFVRENKRLPQLEEMLGIGEEQAKNEDEGEKYANHVLFCDTTPLTTAIYSQYYFGQCDPKLHELAHQRKYDATFLLMPDIPWVSDGIQRDGVAIRSALHRIFEEALIQSGTPFVRISGDFDARFKQGVALSEALLAH